MNTKHLYTSLGSGVTQGSVTDNTIIDSSVIEFYFDNTDCYIDGTSQEGHTVYFNVGGNATGTNVCVVVNNLTDFVPYDDTEVQTHLSLLDTDISTLNDTVSNHTGVITAHGTELINLQLHKQDALTPGDNITIVDNVISATGGGSQEVYDNTERVIGTWFGKPIYRRVIKTESVFTFNSNTWKSIDNFPISGIVIKASIISIDANYVYVPCVGGTDTSGNLRLQHTRSSSMTVRENTYIIAEYTKVGD